MPVGLKDIDAALVLLAETYPKCFTCEPYLPHRPLKIGIDHDLAERCPALNRREREIVLKLYTSRIVYLQSLIEGAVRVDLEGNPAGSVTASDAEHALFRISEIMTRRDADAAAAKAARKAIKAAGRVAKVTSTIAQAAPETPPPVSSAPANSAVKLKDRPVLTLPAFRRAGGAA